MPPSPHFSPVYLTDAHNRLQQIPDDTLPIVMVYKASEQIHNWIRIQEELRHDSGFDVDDLEKFLAEYVNRSRPLDLVG